MTPPAGVPRRPLLVRLTALCAALAAVLAGTVLVAAFIGAPSYSRMGIMAYRSNIQKRQNQLLNQQHSNQ